jgi:hypothetical protein
VKTEPRDRHKRFKTSLGTRFPRAKSRWGPAQKVRNDGRDWVSGSSFLAFLRQVAASSGRTRGGRLADGARLRRVTVMRPMTTFA